jgi:hypothetical protein
MGKGRRVTKIPPNGKMALAGCCGHRSRSHVWGKWGSPDPISMGHNSHSPRRNMASPPLRSRMTKRTSWKSTISPLRSTRDPWKASPSPLSQGRIVSSEIHLYARGRDVSTVNHPSLLYKWIYKDRTVWYNVVCVPLGVWLSPTKCSCNHVHSGDKINTTTKI